MCNLRAPREILFFAQTILRCRKNSVFFDVQPCSAEKTRFFLTCNLAAQKIPRRYCQLTFLATVEKHFRGGCTFVVAKRKIRKQRVSADF